MHRRQRMMGLASLHLTGTQLDSKVRCVHVCRRRILAASSSCIQYITPRGHLRACLPRKVKTRCCILYDQSFFVLVMTCHLSYQLYNQEFNMRITLIIFSPASGASHWFHNHSVVISPVALYSYLRDCITSREVLFGCDVSTKGR
ncbi:uncharacterized protein EKO05_0008723 [Ascochyta rabiei]|uniref:uncharacterized protein n=1 Tax=Didymella rabiei TaxID=5454 RepID=UPI0022051293|nr:uncharacterized protein EKO05_0008723 [Ascochyta rabiei]UPX18423.1 hypothetical protein EKO05_0008723 [Ascochyta rabiei]